MRGPMPGFDVRYATLEFSFKAGCPSELDCAVITACPEPTAEPIEINYLAKDYASFRQLLLDRLATTMPAWRERHVPDLGIALVELLAYRGDYLSQFQDAVATEGYLGTCRQRVSLRRHLRLVDYRLHEGCNARAWIVIESDASFELPAASVAFATVFAGAPDPGHPHRPEDLPSQAAGGYTVFEPLLPGRHGTIHVRAERSTIRFYTWNDQDCCLPKGATSATLRDEWVAGPAEPESPIARAPTARATQGRPRVLDSLQPGDFLLFEEVLGPHTGNPADADRSRRWVVRLTRIDRTTDPLHRANARDPGLPVVEVSWRKEDALPFPLCLSARRPPPDCGPMPDVSVARGNVILVDHGETTTERVVPPDGPTPPPVCDPCTDVGEAPPQPRFEPVLALGPLTHGTRPGAKEAASELDAQDPRVALPFISIEAGAGGVPWTPVQDLLATEAGDRQFVVETDSDGRATLRFGDGDRGERLPANSEAMVRYRVGSGIRGNVGAETIRLMILRDLVLSGVALRIRNPMPATGGTDPEPMDRARLLGPSAFRLNRQRAVTAEDYAELVKRDFDAQVQRAAAVLRWNGSWYEAVVGVDHQGRVEAEPALLRRVTDRLHRYRRIGHRVRVSPARTVPLDIVLEVCVLPHHVAGRVKGVLLEVFGTGPLPDGRLSWFHPDRLTFGEGLTISGLIAAAQAVPGVASVAVTRLRRWGEADNGELESGILRLSAHEIARVDNDPSFPDRGVIRIDVRGGS